MSHNCLFPSQSMSSNGFHATVLLITKNCFALKSTRQISSGIFHLGYLDYLPGGGVGGGGLL